MGAEAVTSNGDLKRLDFVRAYSNKALTKSYDLAASVYKTGKGYAPQQLKPHINAAEEKVTEIGTPYISSLQDTSGKVLHGLDSRVDSAVVTAYNLYNKSQSQLFEQIKSQQKYHEKNLVHYDSARSSYLSRVEGSIHFVKKEGLSGAAKLAAEKVQARVDEARKLPGIIDEHAKAVLARVSEAFQKLQEYPAVKKAMETARPSVDFAWQKYLDAHDAVMAHPLYHKAVHNGTVVLNKVQTTDLYKNATNRLYPAISPYADPALGKLQSSSYYQAAVDHLKPIPANGKA